MSMYATIETEKNGSVELPSELDPKEEGFIYGNNLPEVLDHLDRLAIQFGVPPLSNFIVSEDFMDELMDEDEMDDDGDDEDDEEDEDEDDGENAEDESIWFSPVAGLATVNGLIQILMSASPTMISSNFGKSFPLENIKWILWDLEAYRMILEKAKELDDRFRICVC